MRGTGIRASKSLLAVNVDDGFVYSWLDTSLGVHGPTVSQYRTVGPQD